MPVCFALLKNKSRATYTRLFEVIRDKVIQNGGNFLSLHTVLLDFEQAAHDAAREVFNVETKGCLFHFGQCLIRQINSIGLKLTYENEANGVKRWILWQNLSLICRQIW